MCFRRRDGHNWRKKGDGKTIRETHEKLKVGLRTDGAWSWPQIDKCLSQRMLPH